MANADELIRHGNVGWAAESADKFGQMLRAVFLPVIENFAPFANGNWDTAAIKLMLAIAIYTDDRALFDRALEYYRFGCGDGRLAHYIYSNGQCQESGRDQQHTQLGIAHQGDCCEMAWHQGLDLYGYLDNRLLLGFEYTAKYCLNEDVPFEADVDQTGKYRHSLISVRSALRSVYEQIYNHYVKRKGLAAPWTQKAAEKLRPEGAPFQADATGYGTLLYTRHAGPDVSEAASVGVPAGLHAQWTGQDIDLDFVPLAAAARYVVTRSEGPRGQLVAIRSDVDGGSLKDRPRKASTTYTYQVRAVGSRHSSAGVAQMTGLPRGWLNTLPSEYVGRNEASFDGKSFHLSAAGDPHPGHLGQFFVTHRAMTADGEFVARMLPLFGSQFLTAGIYAGSELEQVLLTISPRGGAAEHPIWSLLLLHSPAHDDKLETLSCQPLALPAVEYGRIMCPVWLKLKGSEKELIASSSLDAVHWSELGSVARPTGTLRAGLALNSGLGAPTTEVCFDEIAI